jgi:hypothetical protein
VATTASPDPGKKIDLSNARARAEKEHQKGRVCLIMGIGRKGLPRSLLSSVPYHLEITGVNIALETATAMGILTYMLGTGEEG